LRSLGLLPNGYQHYYSEHEEAVRRELEAVERGEGTRADRVIEIERELFRLYADPNLREKPALLSKRGGAFYSEAAVRLMVGLYAGSASPQVLNVQNDGTFAELPPDSVVEVACEVSPEGVRPISPGAMPAMVRGLVQGVKAYEELTVEAARTGSRDLALAALIAHPLVHAADKAEKLLSDILRENAAYLPRFASPAGR
jgi:6-phospho-beta-glucosidase